MYVCTPAQPWAENDINLLNEESPILYSVLFLLSRRSCCHCRKRWETCQWRLWRNKTIAWTEIYCLWVDCDKLWLARSIIHRYYIRQLHILSAGDVSDANFAEYWLPIEFLALVIANVHDMYVPPEIVFGCIKYLGNARLCRCLHSKVDVSKPPS